MTFEGWWSGKSWGERFGSCRLPEGNEGEDEDAADVREGAVDSLEGTESIITTSREEEEEEEDEHTHVWKYLFFLFVLLLFHFP